MNFYTTVGKNIKKYRMMRDYSLQELADKIGVTKKTIQRYETGEIKIDMERLGEIARALGIRVSQLVYGTEPYKVSEAEFVLFPIVGSISCGNGGLAYQDIEGYEPTPRDWAPGRPEDYFYLRAKGDSMVGARIYEGDLLLIRKQPAVDNGEIAVVLLDDEAVLKRVYSNGDQLILQSENPKYPPRIAPVADVRIIGKLKLNVIKY